MEDIRLAALVTLLLALACWWYRDLPRAPPLGDPVDRVVHTAHVRRVEADIARDRQVTPIRATTTRCIRPTGRVRLTDDCMHNPLCKPEK